MKLFWLALVREALTHPWQLILTLLSIAVGVAVVVGVDIANSSALSEFDRANRTIDGVATHRIVGGINGIDETVYRLVKVVGRVRHAAPMISRKVRIEGEDAEYQLLGIDPLSDFRIRNLMPLSDPGSGSGSINVSWPLFSGDPAIQSRSSKTIRLVADGNRQLFNLLPVGAEDSQSNQFQDEQLGVLVTDISWAQAFLDMPGRISQIELKLDSRQEVEQIKAILPESVRLVDVALYNGAKRDMTQAFRINLLALGLLALVIAMFLIYSSVSFQIVRRRRQIGLMRIAGITSVQLAAMLMLESLLFAVAGTVLGLGLGYLLAIGLADLVTGTINALYFSLSSSAVLFSPLLALKAGLTGLAATICSSLVPIFLASREPPAQLLNRQPLTAPTKAFSRWLLPLSGVLTLAGYFLLVSPAASLVVSFAGLFLLICALAILTPWVIAKVCDFGKLLRLPGKGLLVKMVIVNIAAHQKRTAVAVAALSVAVSATLGVALMIDSFRFSVEQWLDGYLRSDIYISSQSVEQSDLSPDLLRRIATLPQVETVATGTRRRIDTSAGPLTLFVLATNAAGFSGFQLIRQADDDLWQRFQNGQVVLVSEPFSRHNDVATGDSVAIPTDHGLKEFPIAAVYRDYSSDRGLVTMSRKTYSQFFSDERIFSAAIVVTDPVKIPGVMQAIESLPGAPEGLFIRSNRQLRERSLQVFDQTFRITEVLRWLAIIVSVVGIVSALMALQLERMREYATLKAIGFSQPQLAGQIMLETAVTGLLAGVMAVPLGLVLATSLIEVINLRSYGWSMQTIIAPQLIAQAVLLAVCAAVLAALYPTWRLWRTGVSAGLRNE